jgi:hypothetical protein
MARKTYKDREGYIRVIDGSPYYVPHLERHEEICCDCGKVHDVKFRVEDAQGHAVKGARIKVWAWVMEERTREERERIEVKFVKKRRR